MLSINDPIREAVDAAGGVPVVAGGCKVSLKAVYKWINNKRLPRTEYTGETNYSEVISELSGKKFTADELKRAALLKAA